MGKLAKEVFTIEIVKALADSAATRLKALNVRNVFVKHGDGYLGWPEKAPFDAIIVTAAAPYLPPKLVAQLAPKGRLIIPLGSTLQVQELTLVEKSASGALKRKTILPVQFVPFTGVIEKKKP